VLNAGVAGANNNFGELAPASLAGFVYADTNNDGVKQGTESGISGVTVTLTGTNDLGAVTLTTTTGAGGAYAFTNLRPGTYTISETQPTGYLDGKDTIGTPGGNATVNDVFSAVVLNAGVNGANNNFGERNTTSILTAGMTATIGFWQNKNGQAIIKAMPGTSLGDWLATNFPNMYGQLAGKTSSFVAAYYQTLFAQQGPKTAAQVLCSALAVFVTSEATNTTQAGQALAKKYGFKVNAVGTAAAEVNVGSNGVAYDLPNNTKTTLLELLKNLDARSLNGVILGKVTNTTTRAQQLGMVNVLFTSINEGGDI